MKRIHAVIAAVLVGTVAAVAFAESDASPWVKIWHQNQYYVPQKFEREVQAVFVDAGTIGATTINVTTVNPALAKPTLLDAGNAYVANTLGVGGRVYITAGVSLGNCTLGGQSPAVCTDTVTAGATCVCSLVGTTAASAAKGVACSLSSTTLTATSANGATEVVNWFCF